MKKLEFNEETQLRLEVGFKKKLDVMDAHKTLLQAAAFSIGIKWYQVIQCGIQINSRSAQLVFDKQNRYDTSEGAPVTLHGYYSDNLMSGTGSEKKGLVRCIENRNGDDVVFADCGGGYHNLICCTFHNTVPIK